MTTTTKRPDGGELLRSWHPVRDGLPEFGQHVVATDKKRYWLDVRTDYAPDLTCSGHIATHWWPYGLPNTRGPNS